MAVTGTLIQLLQGMQNGTAILENSLAVSYRVKHTLTICPSILGIYPKEVKILFKWKTCMRVLITTGICNHKKKTKKNQKTTQISLSWWNKLSIVHPYNGMLLSNKKATENWPHNHADESVLCERSQFHRVTYCMISFVWHSGQWKTIGTESWSVTTKG